MTLQLRNWENSCAVDCVFMTMLDGQPNYYRNKMLGDKVPDINAACLDATKSGISAQAIQTAMNETMQIIDGKSKNDKCVNLRNLLNKCDKFVYEKDPQSSRYVISSSLQVYEHLAKLYHLEFNGNTQIPAVCGIEWMSTGRQPFKLREIDSEVIAVSNDFAVLFDGDNSVNIDFATQWIGTTLLDGKYELYGAVSNIDAAHFVSRYVDRRGKWVLADDINPSKVDLPDLDKYPVLREELLKWGGKSTIYRAGEKPVLWFYKKTSKAIQPKGPSTITQEDLFTLLYPLTQRPDGRYRNALMSPTINELLAPLVDLKSGIFGHLRAMFAPTINANFMHHLQEIYSEIQLMGGVTRENFMNKIMGAFAFLANCEYQVRLPSGQTVHRSEFVIDNIAADETLVNVSSSSIFLSSKMIRRIGSEKDRVPEMQRLDDLRLSRSWCTYLDGSSISAKFKNDRGVYIVADYTAIPEKDAQAVKRPDMGIDAKVSPVFMSAINIGNRSDEKQNKCLRQIQTMVQSIRNEIKSFGASPPAWNTDNDKVIVLKGNGIIDDGLKQKLISLRQQMQNAGGQLIRVMLFVGRRLYVFCANISDSDWIYVFDMTDRGNMSDTMKDYITGAINNVANLLFPNRWIEVSYRLSPPSLTRPIAKVEQQFGLAAIILSMVKQAASLYALDLYLSEKDDKLVESDALSTHVIGFSNIEKHISDRNNLVTSIDLSINPATKSPLLPTDRWWDFVPASINVNFLVDLCKKLKPTATVCDKEKEVADIVRTLNQ